MPFYSHQVVKIYVPLWFIHPEILFLSNIPVKDAFIDVFARGRNRKCTPAVSGNPKITFVELTYPKALTGSLPLCPLFFSCLLRIATNEIASFWKDHRSRYDQIAFSRAKAGQRPGKRPAFALCWNLLKSFRYYIKQIDSMLPCVWFSNRSQKTSKWGKDISDTLGYALRAIFLFLPHFDVICDLLLNRHTATWNLFFK